MIKRIFFLFSFFLVFLIAASDFSFSLQKLSTEDLVKKNIQAAGGNEKILQIKNYSFTFDSMRNCSSSDGRTKISAGRPPAVTEVICAGPDTVIRNSFNHLSEFNGLLKNTYQALALLRSGLFTLKNFSSQLEYKGTKTYGLKNYHVLGTLVGDLRVTFSLDPEEYLIRRIVFQGYDKTAGNYEINHDMGPYQDIEGIRIPSSWFSSEVGGRGVLYEISDVKWNEPLEDTFFSSLEINIGSVEALPGILKGAVVEFMYQRNLLLIGTNWTEEAIQKAGFSSKDKLKFRIKDLEVEIDFYDSTLPEGAMHPGAKLMIPNRRGENYHIYLWSQDFKKLSEEIKPLSPIEVRKIDAQEES